MHRRCCRLLLTPKRPFAQPLPRLCWLAGFRYVELTFPGATDQPPPSLETLTAINVRSSVDLAGDLTFGDEMLQKVHVSLVHVRDDCHAVV